MDLEEAHLLGDDLEQTAMLRVLQTQSQGYYELTLLVRAVDALQIWTHTEHAHMRRALCPANQTCRPISDKPYSRVPAPTSTSSKVKRAFGETCAAIEPTLGGVLLTAKDGKSKSSSHINRPTD